MLRTKIPSLVLIAISVMASLSMSGCLDCGRYVYYARWDQEGEAFEDKDWSTGAGVVVDDMYGVLFPADDYDWKLEVSSDNPVTRDDFLQVAEAMAAKYDLPEFELDGIEGERCGDEI